MGHGWHDQHCHEADGQSGDADDGGGDDDDGCDDIDDDNDDDDFKMQGTNLADLAMKAASAAATNHSS